MELSDFVELNVSAFANDYRQKVKAVKETLPENPVLPPFPELYDPGYSESKCVLWNASGGSPLLKLDWSGTLFNNAESKAVMARDIAATFELFSLLLYNPLISCGSFYSEYTSNGLMFRAFVNRSLKNLLTDMDISWEPWMEVASNTRYPEGLNPRIPTQFYSIWIILSMFWDSTNPAGLLQSAGFIPDILHTMFDAGSIPVPITRGPLLVMLWYLYFTTLYPEYDFVVDDNKKICQHTMLIPYSTRPTSVSTSTICKEIQTDDYTYDATTGEQTSHTTTHTYDGKSEQSGGHLPSVEDMFSRPMYEAAVSKAKPLGEYAEIAMPFAMTEHLELAMGQSMLFGLYRALSDITGYRVHCPEDYSIFSSYPFDLYCSGVSYKSIREYTKPSGEVVTQETEHVIPDGQVDSNILYDWYFADYFSFSIDGTTDITVDTLHDSWSWRPSTRYDSYDHTYSTEPRGTLYMFVPLGRRSTKFVASDTDILNTGESCHPVVKHSGDAVMHLYAYNSDSVRTDTEIATVIKTPGYGFGYESVVTSLSQHQHTDHKWIPLDIPLTFEGYADTKAANPSVYESMVTSMNEVASYHPFAVYSFEFSTLVNLAVKNYDPTFMPAEGTGGTRVLVDYHSRCNIKGIFGIDIGVTTNM